MADGGQDFNLGHVVGSAGEKGDDGSTVWNTSTAPTYANSKYTFNISNLSGKTGLEIAVNDIIFYSTYYYIVSTVNTTTVDCSTRVSIKGSDASVTIVTSFGSTTSDSKVPSEKLTKNSLDNKIDKSQTAGLVKNDGSIDTNTYLTSSALSNYMQKSSTAGLMKNDGTVDTTSYSTFSGSYSDLSNKPSIPSSSSDLSDGSDLVKKSSTTGLLKNDGSIDTNTYLTSSAISGMLTTSDIADNLTTDSSTKVLSAKQGKALNDLIGQAITYIVGSGN